MGQYNYPNKIKYLYMLRDKGFTIPYFFIIDKNVIIGIDSKINEIRKCFKEENTKSVIIRSAAHIEDGNQKSLAGFFHSSNEIQLENLTKEIILEFWNLNIKKLDNSNLNLNLFIQEYVHSDYSGVLFTKDIYDKDRAIIEISKIAHKITEGGAVEERIFFDKNNKKWVNGKIISAKVTNQLEKIIIETDNFFENGSDIEFGISNKKIDIFQIRSITKNHDQSILILEKERLKNKFGNDFKLQVWGRNDFVMTIGDLSNLSLSFYNYLLTSKELLILLKEAKIIKNIACNDNKLNVLENIGGKTYFNYTEEDKLFRHQKNKLANFLKIVFINSQENLMRRRSNEELKKQNITIEETFAWLFLSSIYLQMFIDQERLKYLPSDFSRKLVNTENLCKASEPRPRGNEIKDVECFIKTYFYLADYPYELGCPRYEELSFDQLKEKFKYFPMTEKQIEKDFLNCQVQFWFKKKIEWKKKFLISLFNHKKELIGKFGKEVFKADNWFEITNKGQEPNIRNDIGIISDSYYEISGINYPFPLKNFESNELILSSGNIDFNSLHFLNKDIDPKEFAKKFIAIEKFPNNWIAYIPTFKGIVLKEGNQLSHMAIVCREHEIPCIVKSSLFIK